MFAAWEFATALRYLRSRRRQGGVTLVTGVSFVAIALAVAVLIITVSIMNGFRDELTQKILGFDGHAFVSGGASASVEDREALIRRLKAVPGVIEAYGVVESQALAQGPSTAAGAIVRGVSGTDLRKLDLVAGHIKSGSLAGFDTGEDPGQGVVVGARLAETLGLRVGDPITIVSPTGVATAFGTAPPSKTYTVIATFAIGMSQYDQAFIYMPLDESRLLFGRDQAVDFIQLRFKDPEMAVREHDKLAKLAGRGADVTDWSQKNSSYFGALAVEHNVMRLILLGVVTLAALNIITGLVMLVRNKTRDIAILRTMGATQASVLRIFFLCGSMIAGLGAVSGVILGVAFCLNIGAIQHVIEWVTNTQIFNPDVYYLSQVPEKIDWAEVGWILVFAVAAGCLFSLIPAARAARMDPVEALRNE